MGIPIPRPTPRPICSAPEEELCTDTVMALPGWPDVVLAVVLVVALDTTLDDVPPEVVVLDDVVAVEDVVVVDAGPLVMLK